jgi:hypothetical protein
VTAAAERIKYIERLTRKIAGAGTDIVTLESARNFAQAEFDLAQIRRAKVVLISRLMAFGELDMPDEAKNGFLSAAPSANSGAAAMNPTTAAASQDYSRAVADYRNCLTAHPSNQAACEGLRHIMDADAQVLSGSSSCPPSSNLPGAK